MKNLYHTLLILSLVVITLRCTEEPEPIQKKVSIDFTVLSDNQVVADLPPESRLIVNIQSPNGEEVMEYKELEFHASAAGFSTAPLDLHFGNYAVTDFIIVNENDDILYAAPRSGASLETAVEHPLDLSFSLAQPSMSSALTLRLLDVRKHKPSDFGFDSFRRPGQRLNVVVTLQDQPKPSAAKAFLLNGKDTVGHYQLEPKVNQVRLPARLHKDALLVITRDGYARAEYPLADLTLSDKNKTLKVMLTSAFTFLAHLDASASLTFDFSLGGPEGSAISVDWGDGGTEAFELTPNQVNITHPYASAGNYPVTVTGDIDKIISFYSFYGQGMMDAATFDHLTALEEIRFGLSRSPKVIDLSQNKNLKFAMLTGLENMKSLLLPKDHSILNLALEGPNGLTTKALDVVIRNVYDNAVKNNIRGGSMGLYASWSQEEGDRSLIGPPSGDGLAKLKALKDNYGWTILPDPFN